MHQVDLKRHELFIVNNASTDPRTEPFLAELQKNGQAIIITNESNLGTARAVNRAWAQRKPGQHCVKIDDDVVVHHRDWPDVLEEVFRRDPKIGQAGLKRNDLSQSPWCDNPDYRTKLIMLPHPPGERWIMVEQSSEIMGTCVAHSSALLDAVGYLCQPENYGWDDVIMSIRSLKAGFINVFVPHIPIDHIDNIQKEYQKWKENVAGRGVNSYLAMAHGVVNGTIPIKCDIDCNPVDQ